MKPLQDILVIDLSQYLSGPCCTLKLADLGARVIKIERPNTGDSCRSMYVSNLNMNGESSIFRAINRNKESFCADLKNYSDKKKILKLITKADVLVHNFRPGVIKRLGLDYDAVKVLNPSIIYGEISGYGKEGPWKKKPGQDLLVQALSGVTMLSGNANKGPVPLGLAMADMLSGGHLAQGILAGLVQKGKSGKGCKVSVNMLESMLDLQFETVTTYYHDGGQPTQRTESNNAHAYLGAPYGIYQTADGYLALAMGAIPQLGELLQCFDLLVYQEVSSWYDQRDKIKQTLADHLKTETTEHWLSILEPADIWCADVMDWERLFEHDGFKVLQMLQTVKMSDGYKYQTTRCPIKIDGRLLTSEKGSPALGEDTDKIEDEFL
ncbi:CoA transferase [Flammeovirga yaeyamensis]|uniref:CoA transferase n=1 Tax=Flammeovirga yaeyamensis TaxID=367791 RepID=A0AAX1N9A1_9BACT|nr:CaiB/BaiF CoA-transferase family protein [Flammeovirga yaeyamensis]MBB3697381.1 crotonobetainyl-CoA:carnitine CoA-transferase CaiB-like acyl-CoA transferase [Flammeovirga yaeyamensis]NMF36075.1 CoA transferase [Flammeovirga yaeyamensis]QWG02810.1 CoA transferase [Flammeovirga yaeyamensis]